MFISPAASILSRYSEMTCLLPLSTRNSLQSSYLGMKISTIYLLLIEQSPRPVKSMSFGSSYSHILLGWGTISKQLKGSWTTSWHSPIKFAWFSLTPHARRVHHFSRILTSPADSKSFAKSPMPPHELHFGGQMHAPLIIEDPMLVMRQLAESQTLTFSMSANARTFHYLFSSSTPRKVFLDQVRATINTQITSVLRCHFWKSSTTGSLIALSNR